MDANLLQTEINRIGGLLKIEREPAIKALHTRCGEEGFSQQLSYLRELVQSVVNAPQEAKAEDAVGGLLRDLFLLSVKGKVRIGHFTSEQVNGHGRRILNLMGRGDFELLMAGRPEGQLWLNSPHKRIYYGLINDPTKPLEHENKLNLWHGFGIQPAVGDPQPFLDYVTNRLAQGNPAYAEYILNWLAWVVRNPGQRIGVVLCLISAMEGTGKGSVGNLMLTIFGQHGRSVADPEALTGHFNAALADALYVFADEAMFAGDLRGADRFKNRVTEPWVNITPKGVDSIQMENRVSYLMATNHRFAASVGFSDRRFAMFEVSEVKQSRTYWNDLHTWLQMGGKHIVLHHLLNRDLAGWHPVDDRPLTSIYLESRKQSLRETHRWWYEVLEAEDLGEFAPVLNAAGEVDKASLYTTYKQWHFRNEHKASRPVSKQLFWRDFNAVTGGVVTQYRPNVDGARARVIVFPVITTNETGLPMANTYSPDWQKLHDAFERWLTSK